MPNLVFIGEEVEQHTSNQMTTLTMTPTPTRSPTRTLTQALTLALTSTLTVSQVKQHGRTLEQITAQIADLVVKQHGQSAPLTVPQLASCASSRRAWWLWALRHCLGCLSQPPPKAGCLSRRL